MRILVVEDDEHTAQALKLILSKQNYAVDAVSDGMACLQMAEVYAYDLIVLDLMLPKLDGVSVCEQIRARQQQMPILLLTGLGDTGRKITALEAGADDYLVKPFDTQEFVARVHALLRRGNNTAQPVLVWEHLRLAPDSRTVTYSGQPLTLTPKEYAILELLLRHSERVFSAEAILDHAWTADESPGEEAVRTHIKGLRQKLKMAGAPGDFIETVYRVGYRLKPLETVPGPIDNDPLMGASRPEEAGGVGLAPGQSWGQRCIFAVSSQAEELALVTRLLQTAGCQAVTLDSLQPFWPSLANCSPDAILLGAGFEEDAVTAACLEICKGLRQQESWQQIPILVVLSHKSPALIRQVFAAGASDVVVRPVVGPELLARLAPYLAAPPAAEAS